MTRDEIVRFFDRRQDAWARADTRALVAGYAEDCVLQSLMAGTVRGRAAIADVHAAWFAGFRDLVFTSEQVVMDGDRAAETATMTGTDTGGFLGLPPTGKPFRLPMVWIYKFNDDQVVHVRPIYDFTGMLLQIGVLKAKPAETGRS